MQNCDKCGQPEKDFTCIGVSLTVIVISAIAAICCATDVKWPF